ncbi:MAG: hypothetical protein WAV45_10230 [Propionibacteriaceae bacterium]|nr:hypothetical protein [Micropruina sp.]
MDLEVLNEALHVARASERMGRLRSTDWPDLAVALLVEGADDQEVAELAGLNRHASGWTIATLVDSICARYGVASRDAESAVALLARLMAAEFRARPGVVTEPMIRALAPLAPWEFDSDLANRCYRVREFLDCDCQADEEDQALEDQLEALPGPQIPDSLVQTLAYPLRSALPTTQPPRSH